MSKRVPRYEPTPVSELVRRLSEIDDMPRGAVRPLAGLIRMTGVETVPWEAEIWQRLRHWLDALVVTLEAKGASKSEAIPLARALRELEESHLTKPPRRASLVAHAIGILKASGCTTNQAQTIVGDIYALLGWSPAQASLSTVRKQYYVAQTKSLRDIDFKGWTRIAARYERLADVIESTKDA